LNNLREIYLGREGFGWFMLIVWIVVGTFLSFITKIGWNCWWFMWFPVAMSIWLIADAKKESYLLGRRHVAVARSGVYLDVARSGVETDEPGSSHLARRTVLKFESIVSCRMCDTGWTRPHYNVVILTPITSNPTIADPGDISHTVTGLSNGQAFVDLVTAMMKQAKQASSNTGQPCYDGSRSYDLATLQGY
jgi:TM2 domain-containing membrane protein YozV